MKPCYAEKYIFRKLKPFLYLLSFVFLGSLIWFYIHNSNVNNKAPLNCNIDNIKLPFCTKIESNVLEEPSGLGIDIENKVLWTICDNTKNVVSMDYCGNIIGSFHVETGQGREGREDIEGIHYSNGYLYIAVEDHNHNADENAVIVYDTNGLKIEHSGWITGYGEGSNKGFEAITMDKSNIYVAKERNKPTIIKLNKDWSIDSKKDVSEYLKIVSGMFYSSEDKIWLLSSESNKLILWDFSENAVDTTKTVNLDHPQMEGVAIDYMKNLIFIVSDKNAELYIHKLP